MIEEREKFGATTITCCPGSNNFPKASIAAAYDLPVRQGHFDVDDDILYSKQIVRIYDVYIKEKETLQKQDEIIQTDLINLKNTKSSKYILTISNISGSK